MRIEARPISLAIIVMIFLGTVFFVVSLAYSSSTLALLGLGLVFWGAILLYIRPQESARESTLQSALSTSLAAENQLIQELGYKGDATYLPPKYFANPEITRIYVSRQKSATLPSPEQIHGIENQPITRTTQGLLITPSGVELARLMEESLGTFFIKMDLENLRQKLPKLVSEDLEIAENLEIETEENKTERRKDWHALSSPIRDTVVHVTITKPIYEGMFKQPEYTAQQNHATDAPACSAIAIAFAKATGKPVRITDTKSYEDRDTIEVTYDILEE